MASHLFIFVLSVKDMIQFGACFGGQEMIKRKNWLSKPEHLQVVIIAFAVWLFLSLHSQPVTYHWPDSQQRKAPLEASCLSISFRAGLAGRASAPASASYQTWPLRLPPACCSVLGFSRWIFSSPVCFHLLLSTPGNIAFFSSSCLFLNPSWGTSWLHNCVTWSQEGCSEVCLWGL